MHSQSAAASLPLFTPSIEALSEGERDFKDGKRAPNDSTSERRVLNRGRGMQDPMYRAESDGGRGARGGGGSGEVHL